MNNTPGLIESIDRSQKVHSMMAYSLHVQIIDGKYVKKLGFNGVTDSQDHQFFIKTVYNENYSCSNYSNTVDSDQNALPNDKCHKYNWKIVFPFLDHSTNKGGNKLAISVYKSTLGRDQKIGKFALAYDELREAEGESNAIDRSQKIITSLIAGISDYNLHFKCWCEKISEDYIFPVPNLLLLKNKSVSGGVQRAVLSAKRFQRMKNWQVRLWNVRPSFDGELCEWNRDYSAAQKIFGNNPVSFAIRGSLRLQNSKLYRNDKSMVSDSTKQPIRGLVELIDKLPKINKQNNKTVRFTYVITTESFMTFAITAKDIGQDILSKHALHNNAAGELFYAGEFFIDDRSKRFHLTNVPALIIDNNSGTYAPPKERLENLKKMLQFNFGTEIPIFALDREDPLLQELIELNDVE